MLWCASRAFRPLFHFLSFLRTTIQGQGGEAAGLSPVCRTCGFFSTKQQKCDIFYCTLLEFFDTRLACDRFALCAVCVLVWLERCVVQASQSGYARRPFPHLSFSPSAASDVSYHHHYHPTPFLYTCGTIATGSKSITAKASNSTSTRLTTS